MSRTCLFGPDQSGTERQHQSWLTTSRRLQRPSLSPNLFRENFRHQQPSHWTDSAEERQEQYHHPDCRKCPEWRTAGSRLAKVTPVIATVEPIIPQSALAAAEHASTIATLQSLQQRAVTPLAKYWRSRRYSPKPVICKLRVPQYIMTWMPAIC